MNPAEVFGSRVRQVRTSKGWTQKYLEQVLWRVGYEMERSTIAKLENGQRRTTLEDFVVLCAVLGADPLSMLKPQPDPEPETEPLPAGTVEDWDALIEGLL